MTHSIDEELKKAAQDVIDAGVTDAAAQECCVSSGTIRSWARGEQMKTLSPRLREVFKNDLRKTLGTAQSPGARD